MSKYIYNIMYIYIIIFFIKTSNNNVRPYLLEVQFFKHNHKHNFWLLIFFMIFSGDKISKISKNLTIIFSPNFSGGYICPCFSFFQSFFSFFLKLSSPCLLFPMVFGLVVSFTEESQFSFSNQLHELCWTLVKIILLKQQTHQ